MRRRLWIALVVVLAIAASAPVVYMATPNFDGSMPGNKAVVASQPDPRVRWVAYPVGGFGLCNADTCLIIPPGSVLAVPYAVTDSTWERN